MNAAPNYTTRLQELRTEKGLSQQKAADALGIAKLTYQRYEYGQRDIPGDVLIKMTQLFDATADYILKQSDKRERITYGLVSLDGDVINLTEDEANLLIALNRMSKNGQKMLLDVANALADSGHYPKEKD